MSTLVLRPFTEPEYHLFFQGYESDPVMEPMPFQYNAEAISRSFHYNYHVRKHYAHYGIFRDDVPIGCFQLKRINTDLKTCEFGLVLQNDAVKDRGLGTEAVRLGLEIAKNEFGMRTVLGDTSSTNHRMIRVFEKLEFQLVETVPHAYELVNGRPDDRLIYQKEI